MKLGWFLPFLFLCSASYATDVFLRTPSRVKIKNKTYKVDVTKKLGPLGLQGLFVSYPPTIQVYPDEEEQMSFFHELLHAWSHEYNVKPGLTEEQVRRLEAAIYYTFLKNHWLVCNASSKSP